MIIICDSNIWFEFVKRPQLLQLANKHELQITYQSLEEISTSEKLLSGINLVKRVLELIDSLGIQIIKQNPFDHIIKSYNPEYSPNLHLVERNIKTIKDFITMDTELIKNRIKSDNFIRSIKEYDSGLYPSGSQINKLIPVIRSNIKMTSNKKIHRSTNGENDIKKLVQKMTDTAITINNINIKIDWSNFKWDKFILFIKTCETYFKDLELSKNARFKKNDWVDLLNLLYVEPGNKYWTLERKWLNIFKRVTSIRDFQFDLKEN